MFEYVIVARNRAVASEKDAKNVGARNIQICQQPLSLYYPAVTKAVIFDLDSCLAAADEPGRAFFQPVFEAITAAHHGSHTAAELDAAFADMWRLPFDFVSRKHRFTQEMRDAGWNMFLHMEVATPLSGYGDLEVLKELSLPLFLVTSGFRRLQLSKIRALGIGDRFAEIHVDAIDEGQHSGKGPAIEGILQRHGLKPADALIVGDNIDSELAIGMKLGIPTVQTLRPGVPRANGVTHHVRNLHELKELLRGQ